MLLELPDKICGFGVETDYKFWLKYVARVVDSRDLMDREKPGLILYNVFGDRDTGGVELEELFTKTMKFYNCGKEDRGLTPPDEVLLHWEKDMLSIHSDFLLYYKIDIDCADTHMHWWKFRGMFDSLPPESRIKSLIQVRNEDPSIYNGKNQHEAYKACVERKRAAAVWPDDVVGEKDWSDA